MVLIDRSHSTWPTTRHLQNSTRPIQNRALDLSVLMKIQVIIRRSGDQQDLKILPQNEADVVRIISRNTGESQHDEIYLRICV